MAKLQSTSTSSVSYTTVEKDTYEARISRFIIMGVHKQRAHEGKAKPDVAMAKVAFELIGETITRTTADGSEEVPAVVYWDVTMPWSKRGISRGKLAELLQATDISENTLGDTQAYADLIGQPVNVVVAKYKSKFDDSWKNGVNGVSSMSRKNKERLEDLTTNTCFFDPYEDSEEYKEKWTTLGNYVREKISEASDAAHIPAVQQEWPDQLESEDTQEEENEF